ncbi:hypothetical protein ACFV9C_26910 [Kribbella sp. NPDC059898]|uniref:hypothetical protein n=1 Tax=Kribbella sp. NPDC059898 TaxID=3346995 RepID=UPI0036525C8F
MNDLRDLLRAAAADGSDGVDLAEDAVAERIRHRRAQRRRFEAGGVAIAAVATIAGTAWSVLPGTVQPTSDTGQPTGTGQATRTVQPTVSGQSSPGIGQSSAVSGSATPRIVTSDYDGLSGMEAALYATLVLDANGCVRPSAGGPAVTLVWPRGYTVKGDAQSFEILDSGGQVVARSGVPITIGGGGVDHFQDTWTGRDCLAGHLWMVGNISPAR